MPSAEAMLTMREGLMCLPVADYLPYIDPNPEFAEDFQEHEWAEAVQGNAVGRIFGFGAEPAPLQPLGGGARERQCEEIVHTCENGIRPPFHHVVREACSPRGSAAFVMGHRRFELLEGGWGP